MPTEISTTAARQAAVATMLGARSLAVVGASSRPDSFGARMVIEAQRGSARVHLVNPRYSRIDGLACAPSLAALDETPDVVLLGVPDPTVVDALETAAAIGARSAVLFGSAHAPGLREQIVAVATDAGMAVCGAGCMGFVNNALGVRALGYLEPDPIPGGGVSLVTHSGSAFSTLLRARRGFGFRLAVSSGQELVTDTADYVEYALQDSGTDLIGLLLETPRSAPRLAAALRRAADADIPVVILTVGGSPQGRAMVAAHSGALAGDTEGWTAFCAATGAIGVKDLAEFTDTLELFAAGRRPSVTPGPRTGIATVHDSGAERALCADVAHGLDVPFADLAEGTLGTLADLLDEGLVATNPLDVWGTGADTRALLGACLRVIAEDPAVAVTALAVDLVTEFDGDTAYTDALLDVSEHTEAPLAVLASAPSALDPTMVGRLRSHRIPVLEGYRSGLAALGHLAEWPRPQRADAQPVDLERRSRWQGRISAGPIAPFDLLADYGIPVVASMRAASSTQALDAAHSVGYPVALKTAASDHKSDVGGVVLGLADDGALRAAYTAMAARLGPEVTVDAMAVGGVEISVGFVRDPSFGPLLVVAAGGVLVELLADRAVACPPLHHHEAVRLLDALRIRPLLDGWRGAPPVAADALIDIIVGFSSLAEELGDVLDAVEANPVIVSPDGAVAVDVLVIPRA
ncbi:acetate--CoA ligase family protein [soil metagenome]